jgi:NAD(P)-dependent dehydrogenase (short-subunit alcohol dehydrogenase family)
LLIKIWLGESMEKIEGKTSFITGAASGIGFGIAEAFSDAGMKVVMADVEGDALAEAAEKLAQKSDHILAIVLDVTDRAAMAAAADEAEEAFGPVHVVCNNAGVSNRGPLDEASYEDWDWVVGVNLGGVINGIKTFVPRIKSQHACSGEGGHVINTASIAGLLAGAGNGLYATTKHAVVGLSVALHQELKPLGIGVSVLCPGTVDTKINYSSRNRPKGFGPGGMDLDPEQLALLDRSMKLGSSSREIGEIVVGSILSEDLYILPHGEFSAVYQKKMEEILASFSNKPPTQNQLESMQLRAEAFSGFWNDGGPSTEEI